MDFEKIARESGASQDPSEMSQLLAEVSFINPATVVEIGVHTGGNLKAYFEAFDPVTLIGIENDIRFIIPEVLDNKEITIIEGDSHNQSILKKLMRTLDGDDIDFLFIDGDHTFTGVRNDFEMYASFVREGGIIAFHDINLVGPMWKASGVEVNKFWESVKINPEYDYKELSSADGTGTGILYV